LQIREATIADARAIAEVQNEGWRWGYRGLVPQTVLDERDDDATERRWIAAFTDEWREGDAVFLASDDRRAIGMIACGPAVERYGVEPPAGAGEVQALYLREGIQGTGVGRALLARGHQHLRAAGFERAVLWVLERNELARRFYTVAGWRPDGATGAFRFDVDDTVATVVRFAIGL
jgi:GNAT superfamily N-acetyltransferase